MLCLLSHCCSKNDLSFAFEGIDNINFTKLSKSIVSISIKIGIRGRTYLDK